MSASSSRAVASFSKVENQTLVFMGAVSVRVHDKGNLGAWPRVEVTADLLPTVAGPSVIFFFTFHFQESELVHGVTHYGQPTTDISMP